MEVCCGAPFDRDGYLKDTINDCPFAPTKIGVGLHPMLDGRPATVLLTICELHFSTVMDFLAVHDPEAACWFPIEALEVVQRELGPDTWTLQAA
jgi:hypothetical protein